MDLLAVELLVLAVTETILLLLGLDPPVKGVLFAIESEIWKHVEDFSLKWMFLCAWLKGGRPQWQLSPCRNPIHCQSTEVMILSRSSSWVDRYPANLSSMRWEVSNYPKGESSI